MFSKLPQRLTAPFELGDGAKLAFRSQPGGISKLATARNIPENDSYWDQYIVLFDTPSDVFSLISPNDIRRGLLEAPENIATLIRVVTARLFNLVSDHTFPSPVNASVVAYASSFIRNSTGTSERSTTKEVLNCIRVLQRVLPVVFEADGESSTFELEVLWKIEEVEEVSDEASGSEEPQFVIQDEDESDNEGEGAPRPEASSLKKKRKLPSLGERLFGCIIDLLFCCGFTLPTKIQVDHYKINYVIWEKGIGSTADPGPSHTYDANKTEVLRLLLILLSRQIYVPPSALLSKPSFYTLHLVQKTSRRDVLTVLCSLLNTGMNSAQSTEISIQSMAGKLPYNHLVFKGEDPRSNLVGICFQVLTVLLDFQSGAARDKVTGSGDSQASSPTAKTNAFRYFLAKLHRTQDFAFIIEGVIGIFEQHMTSVNNLLPGAKKSIPYIVDMVIFLWKMVELNKKFRSYILESDKGMDVVAYLLAYCLDIKDKPQQHGLCRALSYIVQTLSAEPSFGLKLSSPVKVQLPAKYNAVGTAADFMINAVYSIVATTSGALNSLYPALIIALSNSAPYFKHLSVTTSTRLVQLFKSFSNPLFLLADEGHPRLLFFMLEAFNSVILHNLSDNPNLIYGILTAHKTFEDLGTFTLSRGLREIRRVQLAKEEQARSAEGKLKGKSSANDAGENEEPSAEKARLLESEHIGETELESLEEGTRVPEAMDGVHDTQADTTIHPLTSPTSDVSPLPAGPASAVSEKARGKMRARRSISLDTTGSLERIAAAGVGKNGFVPTQEWVTSWQQGLPLDSVMLIISELLPKIQDLQAARHKSNPTSAIMDLLRSATLTHVLPVAPPLAPRRFIWSDASLVWLTSLIWGEIYVRGMTPLGLWNSTNVRLFYVKHTQTQQRQITETVTNVVGGFFGRSPDSPGRPRSERT